MIIYGQLLDVLISGQKDIASWNNIPLDSILKPGQELNLEFVSRPIQTANISETSSAENYRVRSGDVLFEIAQRFRVLNSKIF